MDNRVTMVAFTGLKAHGKDTAAQTLIDKHGFVKVSFADGLRQTVATALRVDVDYFLNPDTKEEIDPRTGKPRRFWLQWVGTEGFRALWADVWVEWWRAEILDKGYKRVVVTDMRFPNELDIIRNTPAFNALTLRIINPRRPVSGDLHESEIHIPKLDVDHEIMNDSTIQDLHTRVESLLYNLFPGVV